MRHEASVFLMTALVAAIALGAPSSAAAKSVRANLEGFQEVPSLSSSGSGSFRGRIRGDTIEFRLRYADLEGSVLQAHIHFGQKGVNGGISVFLCTNLGNSTGTQSCPPAPATISGVITDADVIGPGGQNIGPGEIDRLIEALRDGSTYINVHSGLFPGGEIRGQVKARGGDDDKDKDND